MKAKRRVILPGLLLVTGICFLAAGVLCIGIGIFRGEAEEVMIKAVNLCLECIGIG